MAEDSRPCSQHVVRPALCQSVDDCEHNAPLPVRLAAPCLTTGGLDALHEQRLPLPDAHAHRGQAPAPTLTLEPAEQSDDKPSTRATQRVTQCDRPTVSVDGL